MNLFTIKLLGKHFVSPQGKLMQSAIFKRESPASLQSAVYFSTSADAVCHFVKETAIAFQSK